MPIFLIITHNLMNRQESSLFPTNPFLDLTLLSRKKAYTECLTSFLLVFLTMAVITTVAIAAANTSFNYSNTANFLIISCFINNNIQQNTLLAQSNVPMQTLSECQF